MVFHETEALSAYRRGYLPEFFPAAAERLGLSGRESLLDVGCGWGDLAIGFAPLVGSLTGLDPEQPSLDRLAERARAIGRSVRTVTTTIEAADENLGTFDLITIGRALWYMDPQPTLSRLRRWLRPGGRVLICSANEHEFDGAAWERLLLLLISRWARRPKLPANDWTCEAYFRGSGFTLTASVEVHGEQSVDLNDVVNRFFAWPQTSHAALGPDAARAERDVRRLLGRYFENGPLVERVWTRGVAFEWRPARESEAVP